MPIRILLADDDAGVRRVIQFKLKQRGFEVTTAENGASALTMLKRQEFDLLLTDMKMPGLNGIELLEQAKGIRPGLEVILITAYADVHQAVRAMKLGAFDYLTKPFEDDQLFVAIEKALKFKKLEDENRFLKHQLDTQVDGSYIPGVSRVYKDMIALIEKISPTDANVLLTGESGTGKEVIARMVHRRSLRADKSFIAVNCAAIPRELIESELFGHVKGAFTGAVRDKKGKFELADGGTLLLDEISELGVELQAKLLRVIQERVIEPVGSESRLEIDIRLIAATNKELKERVARGEFREDLYYRLNVIPIHIPSLRDRREDIPALVTGFLRKFSPDQPLSVDPGLMDLLMEHEWRGNVRELENLMERMAILRRADILTERDLPPDFGFALTSGAPAGTPAAPNISENLSFHDAEKQLIEHALQKSDGNKSKAAELLKIPRHVLVYRLKKYGIFHSS